MRLPATLLATTVLTTCLAAQTCLDNEYPITFVDAEGNPATTTRIDPGTGSVVSIFSTKAVYISLPTDMPEGRYFVQVTDSELHEVLSETILLDRVFLVLVDPNTGERTIVPESTSGEVPALGRGLGGVGQSIPLLPMRAPDTSLVTPGTGANPEECVFKAWIGNCYDPYILANLQTMPFGGPTPFHNPDPVTGECCVRSWARFQVGDQTGSALSGSVFLDSNEDGDRDPGEPGIAGTKVSLDDGTTVFETVTGSDGGYSFTGLSGGTYSVSIEVDPNGQFLATTPTEYTDLGVCGCAPETVPDFGKAQRSMKCAGHNVRFWSRWRGLRIVWHRNLLGGLRGLPLVDAWGRNADPCNVFGLRWWLRRANSWNMAYSLSAELAAMHLNIEAGSVDATCRLRDPELGEMTADDLVQLAIDALLNDNCTTRGNPNRRGQRLLRNALHRANQNRIWL